MRWIARLHLLLAVVDGVAQVSTNGLGGNVVWLRDARESRTFYYAHLDRYAPGLAEKQAVKRGDVLAQGAVLHGDPGWINGWLPALSAVTVDDLRALARDRVRADNRAVLVFVPARRAEGEQ